MTPEERQLLTGLFDRIRASADIPRDSEAETFISDAVRAQPYAPYLLTQTTIVQDQALRAANERLQQLEARVHDLETPRPAESPASFLENLGKSLFGASSAGQQTAAPPPSPSVPPSGPWGQTAPQQLPAYAPPMQEPAYAPQQSAWPPPPAASGGGFLHGALGAAAGVAGGVLFADSIRGLFSRQGGAFGIGSGFGGAGAGSGAGGLSGGETIVNNYYGDSSGRSSNDRRSADDYPQDESSGIEDANDDDSSGGAGGDNFNV